MENKEFENIIKNILKESHNQGKLNEDIFGYGDDDEDLGAYSSDFDKDEFMGDAMKAAMQDIGSEFEPLGKSKFEKNLDPKEFISDLERQNLNLPSDKAERNKLQKAIDTKKKHEKMFGAGSMNEEEGIELPHFDTKSLYHYLKDAFYYLKDYDYAEAAQILEKTLNRDYGFTGIKLNEVSPYIENPNVNKASKISRPKDAEGQPITLMARVEDLKTNAVGKVARFGVNSKGELMVDVHWITTPAPTGKSLPTDIVVRDTQRVVREDEIEEGMGHSHTIGRGQNLKPSNYPKNLKRNDLNESVDPQTLDLWWSDLHPLDRVEISKKHFPEKHYSDITSDDIIQMFDKRNDIEENLDNAQPAQKSGKVYLVVDDAFNRSHYQHLIGKTFDNPPSYATVKPVNPDDVDAESKIKYDLDEKYDFAGEERAYHDMQDYKEKESYTGKEVGFDNMEQLWNMVYPDRTKMKSIFQSVKDELANHRVVNKIVTAKDNMDKTWRFKITDVNDNFIGLTFIGN